MNNETPWDQFQNRMGNALYEQLGITGSSSQTAREVFNNYVSQLMGKWRSQMGIQRLALPEIQLGALSLPNPNMSLDALNGALDFIEGEVQSVSDKVGQAAYKWYTNKDLPIEDRANEFLKERAALTAPSANPAPKIKQEREDKTTVNTPTGPQGWSGHQR